MIHRRWLGWFVGVLVVSVGAFVGLREWLPTSNGEIVLEDRTRWYYVPLEAPLLFNIQRDHSESWVQLTLQMMVKDESAMWSVSQHAPLLSSRLLSAFQQSDVLMFTEEKGYRRIKQLALSTINESLKQAHSSAEVHQVLLTQFVLQ